MTFSWLDCLALVIGYVLGSIPFGLLLTRMAGTKDLRTIGSGNIGATNVLRTGRRDLAAATLVLDAAKGAAAVFIGAAMGGHDASLLGAFGAFVGHLFPIWLKFSGGKGVATFIGCLFALYWPFGLLFAAVWLATAFLTRYSSAAALLASLVTPIALFFFADLGGALLFAVLASLLWVKHQPNISRLLAGTEGKIGHKE